MTDLRCPTCGKLLARRLDNGLIEHRVRHARALIEDPKAMICPSCSCRYELVHREAIPSGELAAGEGVS